MKLRSVIAALHAALLAASPAGSGSMTLLGAGKAGAGAPAFTGPIDVVASPTVCFSLRACSAALRGTKVANVCNSTGGVDVGCADMFSDATTGDLVSQTISSITCPGVNCTVKTLYDQLGNVACTGACDLSQATVANRPRLTTSCGSLGKAYCMQTVFASAQQLTSSGNITASISPYSGSIVAYHASGNSDGIWGMIGSGTGQFFSSNNNTVNTFGNSGSISPATSNDNVWHAFQFTFNSASSFLLVDATNNTGAQTATLTGNIRFGENGGFNNFSDAFLAELLLYPVAISGANATALCHNQFGFWGTSTSC